MFSIHTDATCGTACWEAREEVCRCNCGGRNHGCLKSAVGKRPARTSKIDGERYELAAVGEYGELARDAMKRNEAAGITFVFAYSSREWPGVANVRYPSQSQRKWPELSAIANDRNAALLWVRVAEGVV